MRKIKVNLRDLISGIVLSVFGAYVRWGKDVVLGKTFGMDRMPIVSRADFYIHVLGGALLVLSILLIIRAFVKPGEAKAKEIPGVAVWAAVSLIIFCFIVKPLTFYPAATLLVTFWTFMFRIKEYHIDKNDKKALMKALGISLAFSALIVLVLQLIFTKLLGVRLP